MVTTINTIGENIVSAADQKSSGKTTDKPTRQSAPEKEVAEVQAEHTDTVEIRNTRYTGRESDMLRDENAVKDRETAMLRIDRIKEMLADDYETSQIAQVHNVNPESLVALLT